MGGAGISRARVFSRIKASCSEAYKSLTKFFLRRCVGLERAHGANSPQVTDTSQDRELLALAVARRLHPGKLNKGNETLEAASKRA